MYRAKESSISAADFSVTHVTEKGKDGENVTTVKFDTVRSASATGNARLSGPMMATGWIFLSLRWDLEASLVARFPVAIVLHPKLPASHVRLIHLELSGHSLPRLHN
ncbi:unnamed protein product [Lasius platythorax]